ncbi:MAG: dipeptidase PepV [Clostridia bacterium]|nr:dipeptidase PepV [Clostridia bacterium]
MRYEILDTIVDSMRDELLETLKRWISVPSVKAPASGEGAPYGEANRRILEMALEDARSFGFKTRNIDGYAGDVSLGSGEKTLGMLCHLDVVPAGDGWLTDPWTADIRDGKLYGRGSVDDKGPAVCALFAMRAVKEAGIPLKDGVRLILGCDEETGMSDMRYYASKVKMPDYGFSPDAEFPVINIEKGSVHMRLALYAPDDGEAKLPVCSMYAGERPNVVPAEARAVVMLKDMSLEALKERLSDIERAHDRFALRAEALEDGRAEIVATGVNAHAAMPQGGVNAAGMLLICLKELGAGGEKTGPAIAGLADALGMEYTGERLGIACEDELSGALTCNLGILRYDGRELSALLDIRYPLCGDEAKMLGQAALTVAPAGMSVACASHHKPLHVPADSRIVKGLLKVYQEVTGLEGYTIAIGGGTYSQMMPNTVAFGVCFPGDMDVCHIANEYIDIEKMMLGARIFAHAIAELAGADAEE